jgi:outer membrane protein TolC
MALFAWHCNGQTDSYTVGRAVAEALQRYPAIRVSSERVSAAAAVVDLARTAYLPRLDFYAQSNRATRNNITGMVLPQGVLPGISGPPYPQNSMTNVWGTMLGTTVSWEPFDFGRRGAVVALAETGRKQAESSVARTGFEISTAAADAFLTAAVAEQTVLAARAGLERSKVLTQAVQALVDAELRPGADISRARAELAVSENQLIRSEAAVEAAKATLGQFVGAEGAAISIDAAALARLPDAAVASAAVDAAHPAMQEQRAAIDEVKAQQQILARSYYPRFLLQGSHYARGSGAMADGTTLGGASGLGPNIYNWGLGLSATFPLLDFPSIRARREVERHRELSETARLEQIRRDLNAAAARARANLEGARRIAANTPVQLEAARVAEQQVSARYRAGLATLIEVADAQRLVTQAEIDNAVARLGVWRALLQVAAAQGDLDPFLREAGK